MGLHKSEATLEADRLGAEIEGPNKNPPWNKEQYQNYASRGLGQSTDSVQKVFRIRISPTRPESESCTSLPALLQTAGLQSQLMDSQ